MKSQNYTSNLVCFILMLYCLCKMIYLCCMCVCVHSWTSRQVEVRGQLAGLGFPCGCWGWKLGCHLHSQNHRACLYAQVLYFNENNVIVTARTSAFKFKLFKKSLICQVVVVHTSNPSTREVEADGSPWIWGQLDLHNEFSDCQNYIEKLSWKTK